MKKIVGADLAKKLRDTSLEIYSKTRNLAEGKGIITADTKFEFGTYNGKLILILTATPFIWAIRKEMLRENYEQINEYLVQFVKEPHIKQVLIARSDGTITVATDKKLEGTALSSLYPQQLIGAHEIVLSDDKSGNILVVAPVMGFNKKLGVFLMVYEPEKINFDVSQ